MSKHIKYEFELLPNKYKDSSAGEELDYASVIKLNNSPYSVTGKLNEITGNIEMVIEKITFETLTTSRQLTECLKEYVIIHTDEK